MLHVVQMSSLENALTILTMLSPERTILRVGEVARDSGMPKSTVSRLLKTLCDFQMLEREDDQGYVAGHRVMELAQLAAAGSGLFDRLDAALVELTSEFGFAGYSCVRSEADILILRVRHGSYPLRLVREVGDRMPARQTSVGVALMALSAQPEAALDPKLSELTRYHGFAWGRSLVIPGVAAIATSVTRPTTGESAGISISFPMAAAKLETRNAMARRLLALSSDIGTRLGDPYWASHPANADLPDLSDRGFELFFPAPES